jgi:hypothetical protein
MRGKELKNGRTASETMAVLEAVAVGWMQASTVSLTLACIMGGLRVNPARVDGMLCVWNVIREMEKELTKREHRRF